MTEFDYIDDYFKGDMPPGEIAAFEERISNDPAFAEEVAFYCNTMQVAKEQLTEERKKRFRDIYEELKRTHRIDKPVVVRKWWPYMAAAAVLAALIVGWQLYMHTGSLETKATAFINNDLKTMTVQMSGTTDSLNTAKRLFNDGNLAGALAIFEPLATSANADEAQKDAGIVSLKSGDYDKAINYFTALEKNLSLYSNPGKFFHALALLKRNHANDKEMARQLLQQVVDQQLEGHEKASDWLKDF